MRILRKRRRDILRLPKCDFLPWIEPVFDLGDGLSKAKRLQPQIQPSGVAGDDVGVIQALGVSGDEKEFDIGSQEICEGTEDVAIGKVEQAIAAHPEVHIGQRIPGDVQLNEARAGCAERSLISLNKLGNNVSADVGKPRLSCNEAKPVVVAGGRIEETTDSMFPDQPRKRRPNGFCDFQSGPWSRNGLMRAPGSFLVNSLEDLLRTAVFHFVIGQPDGVIRLARNSSRAGGKDGVHFPEDSLQLIIH